MDIKEFIVMSTKEFYLGSHDFNGLPVYNIMRSYPNDSERIKEAIISLIEDDIVTLTFSNMVLNPHIKLFPDIPKEKQIEIVRKLGINDACIYLTSKYIFDNLDASPYNSLPFTKELFLGRAQLEPRFFDLAVLERYHNDPRFEIQHTDYSYSLFLKDEYSGKIDERDSIYLQTFGLGYKENKEKVIVVYLRYLSDLTPEHQQYWHTFLIKNERCFINSDYHKNTMGEWVDDVSIYEAFIEELFHINKMCELMGKPNLFFNDFKKNRPKDFGIFLRPTLSNYNKFVHVLDKMLSDNINRDFFKGDLELQDEITRKDGKVEVVNKGTIRMLEEWLKSSVLVYEKEPMENIFTIFKDIRKQRQKPAHTIDTDLYDVNYHKMQDVLIYNAYTAVRTIRLIFANHPRVKGYTGIPDWLYKGKIRIY